MEKALNLNNESIRPTYTGQRGICEVCGSEVISKCGTIYPYHWAHKNNKDCDPWYEPKTAWHKKWQDYFPEYLQEVVIKKNDIYHRADILTEKGIVIEIQNSPISEDCLKAREIFYQNMIWIVNGDKFKNNLNSINLLKNKLKKLDLSIKLSVRKAIKHKHISNIISKFKKIKSYNDILITNINIKHTYITEQNNILVLLKTASIEDSIKLIHSKYRGETFKYFNVLSDLKSNIQYCLTEIGTFNKTLDDLLNLPEHIIDGVSYREIIFNRLDLEKFKNIKAILKNDCNSLYKNYISFCSEIELVYKNSKYDLVYYFDCNYLICDIKKHISDLKDIITIDRIEYDRILNEIINNTIKNINESLIENKKIINYYKLKHINNLFISVRLKRYIRRFKLLHNKNINNIVNNIITKGKIERNNIINKYSNLYVINWKWKRKAWDIATKPVYFDFGYDFLLMKVGEDLYKKVPIKEFLELHISYYNILNSINFIKVSDHSKNIEKVQIINC